MFVEDLPGLEAVVELADHPVEQVPLGLGVPVAAFPALTVMGIAASDADLKKAQGININLWTGLGMPALGLFFLIWLKLRPTAPPTPPVEEATADRPPTE